MATLHAALWAHCLTAARQMTEDGSDDANTLSGLEGCGAPLVDLLRRQATRIVHLDDDDASHVRVNTALVARRLDDLIDIAHARFYAYAPSDVPACWRHLYTDASILLFALRWAAFWNNIARLSDDDLDNLVRPLDLALILAGGAGPPSRGHTWIHASLDLLHSILEEEDSGGDGDEDVREEGPHPQKRRRLGGDGPKHPRAMPDFSAGPMFNEGDTNSAETRENTENTENTENSTFIPPVRHPVPCHGPLGLEEFQEYLDRDRGRSRQPLVLTDMQDDWPAQQPSGRPWSSPAYLRWRTLRGRRLVPVEVGRSYVDAGWTQTIVPMGDVLDHLTGRRQRRSELPTAAGTGPMYLAQHTLFTQIPQLRHDIAIPDACYTTTRTWVDDSDDDDDDDDRHSGSDAETGADVLLHAWLGPAGTITPLHTDPHHNLLAQVVGRKYVRLYAPANTPALRPRGCEAGGVDMGNTSQVDVGVMEGWDADAGGHDADGEVTDDDKASFQCVPYMDCILEPGDTLYIPQGWWHYVRSLSVSFSVSFWWN
ncbi:hypothetical protein SPBR_05843 [Sporothrix brasiliensis 5110]|uniref:JmjC domain-containing protein n=1 Tax=Sporothrix brasiliensis 5110 TaxID=1398154 RepID=A0A0C2F4Y6_9PEZI|nr:uncharacterized protein SPBR_05843 [Sporothrix brasiliensis 5110]KIH93979.1 hypothetical protein SPBR_05843 [Sporothrix brasiliensis 5110]